MGTGSGRSWDGGLERQGFEAPQHIALIIARRCARHSPVPLHQPLSGRLGLPACPHAHPLAAQHLAHSMPLPAQPLSVLWPASPPLPRPPALPTPLPMLAPDFSFSHQCPCLLPRPSPRLSHGAARTVATKTRAAVLRARPRSYEAGLGACGCSHRLAWAHQRQATAVGARRRKSGYHQQQGFRPTTAGARRGQRGSHQQQGAGGPSRGEGG